MTKIHEGKPRRPCRPPPPPPPYTRTVLISRRDSEKLGTQTPKTGAHKGKRRDPDTLSVSPGASDGSRGRIHPPDSPTPGFGAQRPPDGHHRADAVSCERRARRRPGTPGPSWSRCSRLELGTAVKSHHLQILPKLGREETIKADAIRRPKTRASLGLGRPAQLLSVRLGAIDSARRDPAAKKNWEKISRGRWDHHSPPGMAPGKGTASPRGCQARTCELGRGRENVQKTLARRGAWPGSSERHQRFPGS
ncbi:uncharacterized protein LOC120606607 [Pteropus medius]|uniref:uncharacterized protein LOC120606607 n=1 Tax=Pteropus vampyrus TaxID=132908 RepID=UPI00196B6A3E|nr:uncharacterized protein LOC120606607 [Pteropus giganteus]